MGYGYCSKCESMQGVALACKHVVAAIASGDICVDASNLEYGDADDRDLGITYCVTFCQGCIDRLALPPSGAFLARTVVDEACGAAEGVCGGCLVRWQEGRRTKRCTVSAL